MGDSFRGWILAGIGNCPYFAFQALIAPAGLDLVPESERSWVQESRMEH